jgi:hypothetical protein
VSKNIKVLSFDITKDYQAEDEAKMIEAGKRKAAERNAEVWNQLIGLSEENQMATGLTFPPIESTVRNIPHIS